jgi:penicillin-binding protein 2
MAIGQGDTVVTPLQMAVAYSALANGGTIWQPQIAKGFMRSDGHVVKTFAPKKVGSLPVSQANLEFLRSAFSDVTSQSFGTGYPPFQGFPLNQIPVAAKTGTGQAGSNKQSTSWFATFAPANNPKYAVVMMVSQGGTGSKTSAPSVRKIYEAIYGIRGSSIDPARSVLYGGEPTTTFPKVTVNGEPIFPEYVDSSVNSGGGATPPSGQSPASGLVATPLAAGWLLNKRRVRQARRRSESRRGNR